ncbi:MAG: class I SAM-dependent methyltransferase [Acidobacteriaceae bacterium]
METASQTQADVSPQIIIDTLTAFQQTAALQAAIELGLFGAVGETAGDVASLARHCSASERAARILCDSMTILGLLKKEDGRYRHSPASAVFLDPRSPACLASTARFLNNPTMNDAFQHLAETARAGKTTLPGGGSVEPENPIWVEFARSMAPMFGPLAAPLAAIALEGLSGPVRVLDIAAGHGLFGIAVAKQNPQARIVAVDWPAVLGVAQENARHAGVEDRYERLPGSAFEVGFGGPFDIALLTNFLHHFDAPTCVALLKKVRASMKPGGRVATLEFVPNEDRVSPPAVAQFSLIMLATTPAGDAYTFRELEAMYHEAGLERVTQHALPLNPESAVVGYAL